MIKVFWAFVKKEMYHILRDTRTLYILFGMPIVLVLIFGYTVTNEFKDASVGFIDQAKDELSHELTKHLLASGHFKLVDYYQDQDQLASGFRSGKIKLGIIIPPDFEQSFYRDKKATIQLIADATEPNYATTLTNYANQMIRSFQTNKVGATTAAPYQIEVESRMFYNPQLAGAYNFIPGVVALILMLICAMMTSLTIAKEKEMGTMDLLLVSPLPPLIIILGKVSPYVFLSFINALVVFAMGYFIFGVPVVGSLALLLALCVLYLIVALALGVLISTRSDNQQTAMMSSLFTLLMPTMLLSGFLFPIASMPLVLQYISKVIPAKYFVEIELAIMLRGASWDAVWFPTMILVIMMVVLLTAAWRNFKVIYK
ncbi:MAG: ABC transporter permease [Bacteroidota bacterium]